MAMVFGLTASASSWETFRWAIKALIKVFVNRPNLVVRHKKFIDMLKWEEIDPSAELTPAFSCTINCGIMDDAGNWINSDISNQIRLFSSSNICLAKAFNDAQRDHSPI
jgi:hypothetical protein